MFTADGIFYILGCGVMAAALTSLYLVVGGIVVEEIKEGYDQSDARVQMRALFWPAFLLSHLLIRTLLGK